MSSDGSSKDKLTRLVSFRLTDADHQAYLEKVEASGLKPSTFFRDCVLTNRTQIIARPKSSLEKSRLLYLFNKASNNINQLAHRANSEHKGGGLSDGTYREILDALDDLSRDMKDILRRVD
jgi:Bacterial mobilisation protein (MobC)